MTMLRDEPQDLYVVLRTAQGAYFSVDGTLDINRGEHALILEGDHLDMEDMT
jgi:hypothetical protein